MVPVWRHSRAVVLRLCFGLACLLAASAAARADALCDAIKRLDQLAAGNFADIQGAEVKRVIRLVYFQTQEALPNATACDLYKHENREPLTFSCTWNGSAEDAKVFAAQIGQCLGATVEWRTPALEGDLEGYADGASGRFEIVFEGGDPDYSLYVRKKP